MSVVQACARLLLVRTSSASAICIHAHIHTYVLEQHMTIIVTRIVATIFKEQTAQRDATFKELLSAVWIRPAT